ncbi:MAG: SDR family NAD(P)-dependent oxidoreductase, partial [Myxococcaceae bacterium]|nr:SDR family NAD(P)-dependent oxidoreductase [Myxococcaceae bacterium]
LVELTFQKALVVSEEAVPSLLQLVFHPKDRRFEIFSQVTGSESWVQHAAGRVQPPSQVAASGDFRVELPALRQRCAEAVTTAHCYETFKQRGLDFGPTFQTVKSLHRGAGEALAEVELAPSLADEAADYQAHPVLLDACFQATLGILPNRPEDVGRVFVPVSIASLQLHRPLPSRFVVHARLVSASPRRLEGDLDVYDSEGEQVLTLRGLRCQAIAEPSSKTVDELLLGERWRVAANPRTLHAWPAPTFLPAPAAVSQAVAEVGAQIARDTSLGDYYSHVVTVLNEQTALFAARALEKLGLTLTPGFEFTLANLDASLQVQPKHQRLFGRLINLLKEYGYVEPVSQGRVRVLRAPFATDSAAVIAELNRAFPRYESLASLTHRCGVNLAEILRGECDPLGLHFPPDAAGHAEQLYADSPVFAPYNRIIAEIVARALSNLPHGRSLRVLEIGAGTGGLTKHMLARLPKDRVDYVFTDIGGPFLARAREQFHPHTFLSVKPLDLEKSASAQGFEPHSFDIVVASDVLHATRSLRRTLENVRSLLAPGGWLVATEATLPSPWLDLVFGVLEGWWVFDDLDVRPAHPLLPADKWRALLGECGFEQFAGVNDNGDGSVQTVLLASATQRAPVRELPSLPEGHWLVVTAADAPSALVSPVVKSLRPSGQCFEVTLGNRFEQRAPGAFVVDPSQPGHFDTLLKTLGDAPIFGIAYLCGLEAPRSDETAHIRQTIDRTLLGLTHLVQAWVKSEKTFPRLRVFTRGAQSLGLQAAPEPVSPHAGALWGLVRVLMMEHPDFDVRLIDLEPRVGADQGQLLDELLDDDDEQEVALRSGNRFARRFEPFTRADLATRPLDSDRAGYRLEITEPGTLEKLTVRASPRIAPGPGELEIEVKAAGLNFKDVMFAMGLLAQDDVLPMYRGGALGIECAGRVSRVGPGVSDFKPGDEVVAANVAQSMGNFVIVSAAGVVAPKPSCMTFEEAAASAVAFFTAEYALSHMGHLAPGERVLIHGGAGGVGLAAIQIAQAIGAEIFATAGTPAKRAYVKSLGVHHVLNSRSLEFADEIMRITRGEGVDVVLNSLAGEAIPKSLGVLRSLGRFLEIGRRDIDQNSQLALGVFGKNLSFSAIEISRASEHHAPMMARMLRQLMSRFERRELKPIPMQVFPFSEAATAFRQMQQSKHIGKVVLKVDSQTRVEPSGDARTLLRADATYLVVGGLSGLGLAVARWLAQHGARHLILASRRGARSEEAATMLESIRALGAQVTVRSLDASDPAAVQALFDEARAALPPIRGVFHAAMVLDDSLVLHLNAAKIDRALKPKVDAAWNLHRATRGLALDHFVLFSSVSGFVGSAGQANYAAANTFLDALAAHRTALGLPGLSVCWGAIADAGYVARLRESGKDIIVRGLRSVSADECLRSLTELLQRTTTRMGVLRMDWEEWAQFSPEAATSRRFGALLQTQRSSAATGGHAGSVREQVLAAAPEQRQGVLTEKMHIHLGRVLGMAPAKISVDRPMTELGLDSLMSVELQNWLASEVGVEVPMISLMRGTSVSELAQKLVESLAPHERPATTAEAQPLPVVRLNPVDKPALRLVCLPFIGGDAVNFVAWPDLLPHDLEVCVAQALSGPLAEGADIAQVVRNLADALEPLLNCPYALYGHSFGAVLAFELARELKRRGYAEPKHLFVAAHAAPRFDSRLEVLRAWPDSALDSLADAVFLQQLELLDIDPALATKSGSVVQAIKRGLILASRYRYTVAARLTCPISALGGLSDRLFCAADLEAWKEETTGAFVHRSFAGNHLFLENARHALVAALSSALDDTARNSAA